MREENGGDGTALTYPSFGPRPNEYNHLGTRRSNWQVFLENSKVSAHATLNTSPPRLGVNVSVPEQRKVPRNTLFFSRR